MVEEQKLQLFSAVHHKSHSLNEGKGVIFSFHAQYVTIDSLPAYYRLALLFGIAPQTSVIRSHIFEGLSFFEDKIFEKGVPDD